MIATLSQARKTIKKYDGQGKTKIGRAFEQLLTERHKS